MNLLLAGLAIFLGVHVFSIFRRARENAIETLGGEAAYKIIYAILSVIGLVLIIYGYGRYRAEGIVPLWTPPGFGRHIAMALMPVSIILLVTTYVPSHIRTAVRHPMITAVMLWAVSHLLVRGDLGSVILFGSFLLWGIAARISMTKRIKTIFAAPTLGPPPGWKNDVVIIVAGALAYAAILVWLHPLLIGVPLIR